MEGKPMANDDFDYSLIKAATDAIRAADKTLQLALASWGHSVDDMYKAELTLRAAQARMAHAHALLTKAMRLDEEEH
jgi:hypothetical protein